MPSSARVKAKAPAPQKKAAPAHTQAKTKPAAKAPAKAAPAAAAWLLPQCLREDAKYGQPSAGKLEELAPVDLEQVGRPFAEFVAFGFVEEFG